MNHNDSADRFWQVSSLVRNTAPLVQNITNFVMQNDTADAIAAVGGTQMTLHGVEEAREIAAVAQGLAVNPGTPGKAWLECAHEAIAVAAGRGTPWVLDPVAVGLTPYRTDAMMALLAMRPTVLKANASELLAMAGTGEAGHGADSLHSVDQAASAAAELASRYATIVVATGDVDLVTDGIRTLRLRNGRPLMGTMVGSGCMLSSVMACFLAVGDDRLESAAAAVAHFTVAGELAAGRAGGPGTLKPLLIDSLYSLDLAQLRSRLRIAA